MILPSLSARSEPSLSAEGTLIDDPFSSADEPSTTSINNQLSSSKKTFVPKPPRCRRIGIGRKKKESNYNYGAARASLNAPHAHHFQVYSAAVSSNINAIDETPPAISPTKEEVKAERDMLHSIAIGFERKLDLSCRKIETLESKSRSLANSLKEEKLKSRTAMEELLLVTTRQMEELIATFQDRFRRIKTEHKADLCKLMRGSDQDRFDNQKYLKQLCQTYKKKISELELDYRICFAEMEDRHQI